MVISKRRPLLTYIPMVISKIRPFILTYILMVISKIRPFILTYILMVISKIRPLLTYIPMVISKNKALTQSVSLKAACSFFPIGLRVSADEIRCTLPDTR